MAVTRQIPLGAAERVPNACAWTNSTREESFEPLVAHHLRLDTSSGPALRLLRTHTARVLTTQMPETRRLRLPRLHTCPQTCPVDHSEIGRARICISVLPQRQKAHSACCEATPTCGIKVHSLPQRATRCSRAAGSWHHPIRVECTRCSATGAALMYVHVASPTLTWLTGPTKQLSRRRPSLHVDTEHWIRPTASNLVKFGERERSLAIPNKSNTHASLKFGPAD